MNTTIDQLYPDIWREIFEYFNAIELFFSFMHLTEAADEVLFNKNYHCPLRGLTVDPHVENLPENLLVDDVISLELHEESCFDIVTQCLKLRSLKLIGRPEWITSLLLKVSYASIRLDRLVLIVPTIGSLYDLLRSIASLRSLRRLEIYANQSEEKIKKSFLSFTQTNVEQLILHSCSSISWNDLSYMLPALSNIRFLDITLSFDTISSFDWFTFPQLRYLRLNLVEVSFEYIIEIAKTMPSLIKLKLRGLVDSEGFVFNQKWLYLFEACSSLNVVTVNISLEQDSRFFCMDPIRIFLQKINLNLRSIDDVDDYCSTEIHQHRWWNLSGIVTKQHVNTLKKYLEIS